MDRRRKSVVWRYFEEDYANRVVQCRLCNGVIKHQGNTTNMLKHLKGKHPKELDITQLTQPPSQHQTQSAGTYYVESSKRASLNHNQSPPKAKSKKLEAMEEASQKLATSTEEKNLLNQFMAMVAVDLQPDSDSSPEHQNTSDTTTSYVYPKGKKSPIWQFYDASFGSLEAKCLLCSGIFRHHGNTTNLMKHLRARHAMEAQTLNIGLKVRPKQEPNTRSIISSTSGATGLLTPMPKVTRPSITSTSKSKLFDQKVMTMIIMDLLPLSSVDSKYFSDLMQFADPRYSLPTKKTITSELLPKLYKETVDHILIELQDIKHIAITTELWTPRHQESYLGVTAHFISPEKWTMQSFMLSTTTFYGTPTGKHISSELERTLAEWNITDKVGVMVTDNETNSLLSSEQLLWAYIPCLGHLIHIVVTDAISTDVETTALIEKISSIVRYFKGDDDSKEKLTEAQKSLNLPEHKLVLHVPSRWNSVYFMLERVLEQMDAINAVLEGFEKDEMCLTSLEGDILKMIITTLKPFDIATKTISSENSTTIGTAMPLVKGLLKMMNSIAGGREPLATALKEGLEESFGKIEDIDWIVAATVLDPRFKKFPYMEKEVVERATEIISGEIANICQPEEATAETEASVKTVKTENDSLWLYLDLDVNSNSSQGQVPGQRQDQEVERPPSAAAREFQRYLEAPPVSREDNPLCYWRQHQELFPTLSKVALKYLTVPITSIPCERLFTKVGESLADKRSKLKAKNINMMLFLHNNLPHVNPVQN